MSGHSENRELTEWLERHKQGDELPPMAAQTEVERLRAELVVVNTSEAEALRENGRLRAALMQIRRMSGRDHRLQEIDALIDKVIIQPINASGEA